MGPRELMYNIQIVFFVASKLSSLLVKVQKLKITARDENVDPQV